jgi:hypothetical protein
MPTPPGLDGGKLENDMNIKNFLEAALCFAIFAGWGVMLAMGV